MKRLLSGTLLCLVSVASVCLRWSPVEAIMPPEVSFQGFIQDASGPVNGDVEMTFALYECLSAVTCPTPVWEETQTLQVVSGVYSALLGSVNPFGADPDLQPNTEYWLGVRVGTEPELTPRQKVTSVFFAFMADSANQAGAADFAHDADMLDSIDSSEFQRVTTGPCGPFSFLKEILADGTIVCEGETDPQVNELAKTALVPCADGQVVKRSGTSWICSDEIDPTVNPLGQATLTCNAEWVPKWNGSQWVCAPDEQGTGEVPVPFVLTETSVDALIQGVNTGTGSGVYGQNSVNNNSGFLGTSQYGVEGRATGSTGMAVRGEHLTSGNVGYLGGNGSAVHGTHDVSGNIGFLGSNTYGVAGLSTNGSGYGVMGYTDAAGDFAGVHGDNGGSGPGVRGTSSGGYGLYGRSTSAPAVYGEQTNTNNVGQLASSSYGVLGVNGTSQNSGYLGGSTAGARGRNFSTGNEGRLGTDVNGVYGIAGIGVGVRGEQSSFGNYGILGANFVGAYGYHNGTGNDGSLGTSDAGVSGESADGYGVKGTSSTGTGVYGQSTNGYGVHAGSTNSSGLYVEGYAAGVGGSAAYVMSGATGGIAATLENNSTDVTMVLFQRGAGPLLRAFRGEISGPGVVAEIGGDSGVYGHSDSQIGVKGQSIDSSGVEGHTIYGNGVEGHTISGHGVRGETVSGVGVFGMSSPTGYAGWFDGRVMVAGRQTVQVLEVLGGADLSEKFEIKPAGMQSTPEAGMVVSIDPAAPGELVVSAEEYDRKVAGIISGAGNVRPGMLMGQQGTAADGESPVALTGRVYVLADASYGEIAPGDLLTSSNTLGHAMKVTDYDRAQGAIIGKAMGKLSNGKGLVLVLVSLQ